MAPVTVTQHTSCAVVKIMTTSLMDTRELEILSAELSRLVQGDERGGDQTLRSDEAAGLVLVRDVGARDP